MRDIIDQMGRTISVADAPQRIISLVPSQTELLFDLGLRDEVVGITKFCIHPKEWHKTKMRVGGTKKLKLDVIRSLNPDIIIGNKEENLKSDIELLMKEFPVWMSDIKKLDDALEMILKVGEVVNRKEQSENIYSEIKKRFEVMASGFQFPVSILSSCYLIWKNPLITVGGDTFINDMISRCGFENVFGNQKRYPEISAEQLRESSPDFIFLSSEPFPFKEKHLAEFKNISSSSKIILVDGEMFSWYGSRLLKAPEYFTQLIEQVKSGK